MIDLLALERRNNGAALVRKRDTDYRLRRSSINTDMATRIVVERQRIDSPDDGRLAGISLPGEDRYRTTLDIKLSNALEILDPEIGNHSLYYATQRETPPHVLEGSVPAFSSASRMPR